MKDKTLYCRITADEIRCPQNQDRFPIDKSVKRIRNN